MHDHDEPAPMPVPEPVPHVVPVAESPLLVPPPRTMVEPSVVHEPVHAIPIAASPPPPLPVTVMPPSRAPSIYPGDLAYADAERERAERFDDMHGQLVELNQAAEEAEERRDATFRDHEDERERIFAEHEQRREQEATQTRDDIIRLLEERLAAIPQLTAPPRAPSIVGEPGEPGEGTVFDGEEPPVGTPGAPSVHDSERRSIIEQVSAAASGAATQYAEELRETVRLEREELARAREEDRAERERMLAELAAERDRMKEEQDARIRALEEELATTRTDLENERQMRMSEENQRHEAERAEDVERSERFEQQLLDVTNIVSEQRDEMIRKKEEQEQKWADKMARMQAQEEKMDRMLEFMSEFRTEKDDDRERQQREQLEIKSGKDVLPSVCSCMLIRRYRGTSPCRRLQPVQRRCSNSDA